MDVGDIAWFSSEELTRIYCETAAEAAEAGDRLTVLLAPYSVPDEHVGGSGR